MAKKHSVTIKVDERLVREARHEAVNQDLSLSAWVARLIQENLRTQKAFRQNAAKIIESIKNARAAGGEKFDREALHAGRLRK